MGVMSIAIIAGLNRLLELAEQLFPVTLFINPF